MPTAHFTDATLRRVKSPNGKQVLYSDLGGKGDTKGGLTLRVSPGGAKTFLIQFYTNGKPKYVPIGRYPTVSLKEARSQTRKFLVNPANSLRERERRIETGTFREMTELYIERHVRKNRLRSESEIIRRFERYVLPVWGDLPFLDIRRGDVSDLLDRIEDENGPVIADRVLADLRKMMRWRQVRDENYTSAVVSGMGRASPTQRARKRILNDDEIRRVINAAPDGGTFGNFVEFSLRTGQRRGKVADLRWDDIDQEGRWTIRTEEREKGNPGLIKLPPQALSVIERQRPVVGNPFIFPASRGGGPINNFSGAKRKFDEFLGNNIANWRIHDLRRSARSLMSRCGIRPDIAEKVLGHATAGIARIYDQYSYADEIAHALRELNDLIDEIVAA